MTLSDLGFLVLVLATGVALAAILVKVQRGRRQSAGRLGLGIGVVWAAYLAAGLLVAVATPQTIILRGGERCFDEMCFSVAAAEHAPAIGASVERYVVTVETANHGRAHAERERGAEAFLMDSSGRKYWPSGENGAGLDSVVAPGESARTRLQFDIAGNPRWLALGVEHSYWLNPGRIVIGDDEHLGHRPTVMALE